MTPATGLKQAIEAAGSRYRLAKQLGLAAQSVYLWEHVPIKRVIEVERITGIDRAILRPDFYDTSTPRVVR